MKTPLSDKAREAAERMGVWLATDGAGTNNGAAISKAFAIADQLTPPGTKLWWEIANAALDAWEYR